MSGYTKDELSYIAAYRIDQRTAKPYISITVRNPARRGAIKGTRVSAWGKNVRCIICQELVGFNNEKGHRSRKLAEITAGRHLIEHHPEVID